MAQLSVALWGTESAAPSGALSDLLSVPLSGPVSGRSSGPVLVSLSVP